MKICWIRFVLTSLLILGIGTSMSFGQAAEQFDPNNIPGFPDQGPTAEDEAAAELLQTQTDESNRAAAALAAQGDLNGALVAYEEATQANPNFTSYLESARILVQLEELNDAIESYSRAIQMSGTLDEDPKEVAKIAIPAFLELGQAYLDTEQYNQALNAFTAAAQLPGQSRNAETLYNIGVAQSEYTMSQQFLTAQTRQEELTLAMESFDKAIKINPDYADALYERGNTHVLLGDADKAIDDLEKAVQLDPANSDAIAQLGFVSLQRGLQEANRRNGQTAKILRDLQMAHRQLSQYLATVPEDQEVDEEDPDAILRENILVNRSAANIGLGDEAQGGSGSYYQQAIADANAAIEIDPEKSDAHYQKGMAFRMLGDHEAAIEAYTEAIELSPSVSEYVLRRGIMFFRTGDLELAKADLNRSVLLAGGFSARAYFWLGLCNQKQEEPTLAIRDYTRAIRLSPEYHVAYLNRGIAYMKMGRYERAKLDFNQVLRQDRKNTDARSLRDQATQLAKSS